MQIEENWKSENLETRSLLMFFLIAFAWSWIFWSPFVLNILQLPEGTGTSSVNLGEMGYILPIILVGPFGPTIGAFVVSYLNKGKEGINQLWIRFRKSNITNMWLFITFFFFPLIFLLLRLSSAIIFNVDQPKPIWINNPLIILVPFIASILHGGLSEEFGWRGYALPRLQSRFDASQASLILGFFEGLWHVPLVFWVGDARFGMSIPLLIIWQMMATFYRTWIFNNTEGSVLAAILFHVMGNTTSDIVPINTPYISWLPKFKFVSPYILLVFFAIILIIGSIYGFKDLRRVKKFDT